MMHIEYYFLLFLIYSCLGWVMEVLAHGIYYKKLSNRGFLIGPICPIYGIGAILIILLLHHYAKQPLVLFVFSIIVCSILEYFTSYILEKIFKVRWWDYSERKFNLNGRICLYTMLPFGLLGLFIVYLVNPFILNILQALNNNLVHFIFYVCLLIFLVDLIISLEIISNIKVITSNIVKDNTSEIKSKVKKTIFARLKILKNNRKSMDKNIRKALSQSYFTKRILNAFPKFQISKLIKKDKKDDK